MHSHIKYVDYCSIKYRDYTHPERIKSLNKKQWEALEKALSFERESRTKNVNELIGGLHFQGKLNAKLLGPIGISALAISLIIIALMVDYWGLISFFDKEKMTVKDDIAIVDKGDAFKQQASNLETFKDIVFKDKLPAIDEHDPEIAASNSLSKVANDRSINATENIGFGNPQEIIKLWTDKEKYRVGEELVVSFTVQKGMYVRIAVINSIGEITALFPNSLQLDNYCKPDVVCQVPAEKSDVSLFIAEPTGIDKIVAIAGSEPFIADMTDFNNTDEFMRKNKNKRLYISEVRYMIY